jgi:hypothetical protein
MHSIDGEHGNMIAQLPPDVICQRLGQSIDLDAVRGLLGQAVRYSLRNVQLTVGKMEQILQEQLELLKVIVASVSLE